MRSWAYMRTKTKRKRRNCNCNTHCASHIQYTAIHLARLPPFSIRFRPLPCKDAVPPSRNRRTWLLGEATTSPSTGTTADVAACTLHGLLEGRGVQQPLLTTRGQVEFRGLACHRCRLC